MGVGKARVVECGVGLRRVVDSGKCPCGVCGGGVGAGSVGCALCVRWVHGRCGGVGGRLGAEDAEAFGCGACVGGGPEFGQIEGGVCWAGWWIGV